MKIIVYCQHVLGIGHFFRTLEICRALEGHDVVLVTGGPRIDAAVPAHVRRVRLPGLGMNRQFKGLYATDDGRDVTAVKAERRDLLLALMDAEAPAVLMLELYPFGRKAFRFEIDPVLDGIRNRTLPPSRVVCSLRDILVDREDRAKYEQRVVGTLNRYFDALLVHSDPGLIRLEETFSRMADIALPVIYTGFVTPAPAPGAGDRIRRKHGVRDGQRLIVASAGGGKVGRRLLEAAVTARTRMRASGVRMQVFTGPYLDDGGFDRLKALAGPGVHVSRFSREFTAYLDAADLSVSMGGYNTTMNVLAAGTPALIWPFSQNQEQRLRAERLTKNGAVTVLEDRDLDAERLAAIMDRALAEPVPRRLGLNIDGARNTAEWLEKRAAADRTRREGE